MNGVVKPVKFWCMLFQQSVGPLKEGIIQEKETEEEKNETKNDRLPVRRKRSRDKKKKKDKDAIESTNPTKMRHYQISYYPENVINCHDKGLEDSMQLMNQIPKGAPDYVFYIFSSEDKVY